MMAVCKQLRLLLAACAGLAWAASGWSAPSELAGHSPSPYTIDVWETEDGLPQNSMITITQTRDGYLWLGTLNGLVRFDGIQFTVFDENNTPELKSSRIVSLFEDRQQNLWIGTETAGMAVARKGVVTSLDVGKGAQGRLTAACEDAEGAVWFYTAGGQLWRFREGTMDSWNVGSDYFSATRTLIAEDNGYLWVGTDYRQIAFAPKQTRRSNDLTIAMEVPTRKLDFLLPSESGGYWRLADGRIQKWRGSKMESDLGGYPWVRSRVTSACEDRQGRLWVGTYEEGIYSFDPDGRVTSLSTNEGLSYNIVLSLHMDHEGSLWVGTDGGGLNRVKRQVFDVLEPALGLVVQSVCEDVEGGLWIGSNGGGAAYWKERVFKRYGFSQGLLNSYIKSVYVDRDQVVWAGTGGSGLFQMRGGRFQFAPGANELPPVVLAMHQDRQGQLWLGTDGGGVQRWDGQHWKSITMTDGLSSDVVRALAEDADGSLWIGTERGGLNHLKEGAITVIHKEDGLPGENISSLHMDGEGVLWVGTFGSGLGRYYEGQWTRYTTREGLLSNFIGYMLEDGNGSLWIGSNAGLMRMEKKALNAVAAGSAWFVECRAYQKADGLPTSECPLGFQPGACRTQDGKLWFPTIKGLVSLDPSQLKPNPYPPPVMIESVLLDGQAQTTNGLRAAQPDSILIPAGRERLEIHYTSLNLAAPERARFKYRLEGHETAWVEAGNSRVARYSKLPPGRYQFQVTACNEDGVWNESGRVLAFIVQPPFWRTWWFVTAASLSLLGAIVAVVHYLSTQRLQHQLERLRHQEALEKDRARIARDIHDQLGASLTQVSLLGEMVESDKDSPEEVEAHARQISQTARDTTRVLDEIVWTVNPSNDTLDGLINYVCKYAQEYLAVAGLRYRLEVPAQLPERAISPEVRHNVFLASKEAVTNVVRHARATSVWIRLQLEPSQFTLEIEDDGRGLGGMDEKAARTRNGLRNMGKRMEDVGGHFSIGPSREGGTAVRLTAPFGTDKIDAALKPR